jgi:hypothetical protein
VISDEYRYIFFCNPLTGSTSVSRTLVEGDCGYWTPKKDLYDQDGNKIVDRKHGTLNQVRAHGVIPEEKLGSYFKFAGIRNPFDQTVSQYYKMRKLGSTEDRPKYLGPDNKHIKLASENEFPEYVKIRFTDRTPFQLRYFYIDEMDFFLRQESLAQDFSRVIKTLGLPDSLELKRLEVFRGAEEKDYRRYYTDEARELVQVFYQQFLDHFGYSF